MTRSLIACSFIGLGILAAAALHAGPLNPPGGPVASSYKTLSEVEPRTAINATNTPGDADSLFRITQPGTYYLTAGITGVSAKSGIEIASDNVVLDLSGFNLQGIAGSLDGITTDAAHNNITIRNGTITGWGQDGLDLAQVVPGNACLIEEVIASDNTGRGIVVGNDSVLRACSAYSNGSDGIHLNPGASVHNCMAAANVGFGISATSNASIVDCSVRGNAADGIRLLGGSIAIHCSAIENTGAGISTANYGCLIADCSCSYNVGSGISLTGGSIVVRGCSCYNNGNGSGIGIILQSGANHCRIEDNNCSFNDTGIKVFSAGNLIIRNTCASSNVVNWNLAIGNDVAPIVQATTNAALINGATYTGNLGSTDPNANFSY